MRLPVGLEEQKRVRSVLSLRKEKVHPTFFLPCDTAKTHVCDRPVIYARVTAKYPRCFLTLGLGLPTLVCQPFIRQL